MKRSKHASVNLMRPLRLRGEEGWVAPRSLLALIAVLVGLVGLGAAAQKKVAPASIAATSSHSTTIALTSDEQRVVVVNREANSVSIIRVKNMQGNDIAIKIAEIGVGEEPRCVAIHPNDQEAYVTNGISGTVSVVNLGQRRVVATIKGFTEPRGCALTADGSLLYVANHTAGTVSIVDTASRNVVGAVNVGRNPTALAITNKGTGNISDDIVFVTQIFAELNPDFKDPKFDGNGENRDLGKQGVVHAFPAGNANPPISKITLAPLADSGFNANRVTPNNFCNTVPPGQSLSLLPEPGRSNRPHKHQQPAGSVPEPTPVGSDSRQSPVYTQYWRPARASGDCNVNVQALVSQVDTYALADVGTQKPEPADPRGDRCASAQSRPDLRQRHRGHRCQPRW